MPERRFDIQVGIALVAALLILVFGLMWFQEYQLGISYQEVSVVFPAVGGLGAGDPVRVRGISMGSVKSVDLSPEGVMVKLRLRNEVVLAEDAEIRLGSAGIMGERMIALEPGRGRPADVSNKVFDGHYEAAITEMMGQLEDFNVRVMAFLERADSVLAQVQDDDALANALRETTRAAKMAGDLLERNRGDIRGATEAMSSVAQRLDRFLTEHEGDLSSSVEGMARATAKVDTLVTEMSAVVDGTQDLLTALREQKGAAGKLLYDEEMGQQLEESVEMLRFLIEDLRVNPQRYLKVKIF